MWKHALHLYLEKLETMDSTFSGGHLPGVHSGCGSPLRMGVTETGGKRGLHHWFYPFFYLPPKSDKSMVGRLAKSLEFLLDIGGKVRCSLFSALLGFTLRLSCKIQKQVSFQKYLLGYYS